jgi:transcriptional regulator with XRE-family HTH domain
VTPQEAKEIGAAIWRKRDEQGVSREQVAAIMGIDVSDVAALEMGTGPGARRAIRAAVADYRRAVRQAARAAGGAELPDAPPG